MRLSSAAKAAIALLVLVGVACTQKDPQQSLQAAQAAIKKKDYKAATIEIKNLLQRDVGSAEARFMLGTVLALENNPAAAEVELRKALAAGHPAPLVVPELAKVLVAQGKYKKLVDEFSNTVLDTATSRASLQSSVAAAHQGLGNADLAKSAVDKAFASVANFPPAMLVKAQLLAAAGDPKSALEAVGHAIEADPSDSIAWKLKGDLQSVSGAKPEEVQASYRKSVEADPQFAPGYAALLLLSLGQGNMETATKEMAQLNRVAGRSPYTKLLEARLEFQRRNYKRARELMQLLVVAAPKNPTVLQLAGAVEFQLNSLQQAESYLAAALKLAPNNILSRRLLIATYLRVGQSSKALATLQSLPERTEMDASLLSLAGEVYLQSGDTKKAQDYFSRASKLEPDNLSRRTSLALTQLASGQSAAAFDALEDIAKSDKGISANMALISAFLQRKDYSKALAAIDKLEAKQPDKPLAAELRGRTLRAMNDLGGARKSFERALEIDPLNFSAASSLASLDLAEKRPEDAMKRFENMLAKDPKHVQALLAMAQLASGPKGKKEEVATFLARAVEANPTDELPRLRLIDFHLRANDLKQATAAARDATTTLPQSAEILEALGIVQQRAGELNQAIATLSKVTAMIPLSPQAQLRLAAAHEANKDLASAEQCIFRALDLKPDLLEAQRALILLQIKSKKHTEALKVARSVQQQRPQSPVGFTFEGEIYSTQKNWNAAISAYRSALQRSASTDLAIKLHASLIEAAKNPEAAAFVSSWIKEHPKDLNFVQYLGTMSIARKDYADAERYLQTAMQMQPDNPATLNNMAFVAGQLGRSNAIELAEKANTLAPNQAPFLDTLAMLLSDRKAFSKAIEIQTKAVELQPKADLLRLNLAKISIAAGDNKKATAELEKLTGPTSDKESPSYKEALTLLKSMR